MLTIELPILPIIGSRLPPINVPNDEIVFLNVRHTPSPVESAPKKSCTDALTMPKEPVRVVLASSAVVPLIFIWSCTTEIAFAILLNDISPSLTDTFSFSWESLYVDASFISLAISVLVPPYPNFRLSSIV